MKDHLQFSLSGLEDIQRKLEKLPRVIKTEVASQSVKAGIDLVRQEAQRQAPVGPGVNIYGTKKYKPGTLRRQIKNQVNEGFGYTEGVTRSGARHTHLVHDGHRIVVNGKDFGSTSPNPFMTRAFELVAWKADMVAQSQFQTLFSKVLDKL